MEEDFIINKVEQSGIITLDLEKFRPRGSRLSVDLKDFLFEGLLLKEKDFREKLNKHDWTRFQDAFVALYCSEDTIVPAWAWMLVTRYIQPFATKIFFCRPEILDELLFRETILSSLNPAEYKDAKVILKGCGTVPETAYIAATQILLPEVKSLMYGEACSAVPVYKQPSASRTRDLSPEHA